MSNAQNTTKPSASATQHTPGPWGIFERSGRPLAGTVYAGFAIKGADGKSVVACASSVDRSDDEKDANARLIAAAPDMLEALRFVLSAADRGTLSDQLAADVRRLRDVVAKATGAQP